MFWWATFGGIRYIIIGKAEIRLRRNGKASSSLVQKRKPLLIFPHFFVRFHIRTLEMPFSLFFHCVFISIEKMLWRNNPLRWDFILGVYIWTLVFIRNCLVEKWRIPRSMLRYRDEVYSKYYIFLGSKVIQMSNFIIFNNLQFHLIPISSLYKYS